MGTRQTRADYTRALLPILDMFESGEIPEATERSLLVEPDDNGQQRPIDRWSFNNKLVAWSVKTQDARTCRQWNAVQRRIEKGSKAFYIWAPIVIDKAVEGEFIVEDGKRRPKTKGILIGYRTIPEFRVEDTSGEPVVERVDAPSPANAPAFMEVARLWDIDVNYAWSKGTDSFGAYVRDAETEADEGITLASHDVQMFLHALAHAAHKRVVEKRGGKLGDVAKWKREIVAEVSAAAMVQHVGLTPETGVTYPHIAKYAREANMEPMNAVLAVLRDVKDVLGLVVEARAEAVLQTLGDLA
jgi:hypothetical protein